MLVREEEISPSRTLAFIETYRRGRKKKSEVETRASPDYKLEDFVRDLVDIDTIVVVSRTLGSYESFLNASTKLTYIRLISINDKEGGEKRREAENTRSSP